MKICNKAVSIEKVNNYWVLETDGCQIRIWFLTDDIIRIRAGFDEDFAEESYSLVMTAWEDRLDHVLGEERTRVVAVDAVQETNDKIIELIGSKLHVIIEKEPFRMLIKDKSGEVLHRDVVDLAYMEDSNHRRIHTSEILTGDCFYGFGEKTGSINKIGKRMSMSPKDAMGYNPKETDSLYKHIPFYIKLNKKNRKAVGYFYHNTYECDFDMGREKSNYWPAYSRYRTDGGDVDLFFIHGPSIREVVERYTDLTGKSAMLPRYALGYLGSSMYYPELERDCDDAILDFIDTNREEQIPIDGFQLSSGYTTQATKEGNKRCVFTWNQQRFKDPERFFEEMKEKGVQVTPNVKPGILLVHPDLSQMKAKGIFVKGSREDTPAVGTWWGGKGHFVDFTNQSARVVWKEMLTQQVLEKGTASVWNDNCEYDSLVDKDSRCDFDGKGGRIGQLKTVMSNLMCKVTKEAIVDTHENERPYIVCRSGHSGIQRYAQTWAGDNLTCWDSLKYNIATILGMSLSGVANQGCDVAGFFGPAPEAELLVRWVQNGIFQPRFSIHSVNTDNTVTEPWMYPDSTEYIREAIRFRYRLIPYLYSLMERAHERGLPIMEPIFSAFQQDEKCYDEGIDFMLGDSLLVANVVEKGARTRAVYLPEGEIFYDFYTRKPYIGGQVISMPVKIDSIPLFVRGGGIIPMAMNQLDNLNTQQETALAFLCADSSDGEFVLYEDDGISMEYQRGHYLKTRIKMESGLCTKLSFVREGSYISKIETVHIDMIHPEKSPYHVYLNGEEIPHFLYRKKYDAADLGWHYSLSLKSVQIKYPNPKADYEVQISYETFDMIGM